MSDQGGQGDLCTRVGTPIAASGRCPTAHLKNSGNAGRQSRRPPSAMSRKQGGRGARRSRGPSRTKHAEPGQGSGGGSATRLPAMTPRPWIARSARMSASCSLSALTENWRTHHGQRILLSRSGWRGVCLGVVAAGLAGRTSGNLAVADATGTARTESRLVDADARGVTRRAPQRQIQTAGQKAPA